MAEIATTTAAGGRRGGSPSWAVTGAVTTTIACVLPVFLVGGLAVQIGDELRFSPAGLGLAVSTYFGVSALASVPAGRLTERYGPTVTARTAIMLAAASLLGIAALARSFAVLIGLLAAGAAANALGQLASNASLARRVPANRQGVSFGLKQAAVPLSTLLAGVAVPTVALTLGWRWAFGLAAALALGALFLVPADRRSAEGDENGRKAAVGTRTGPPGHLTLALVAIGVAATLAAAAANALGTFLVDASESRGLDPGLAGLTLTFGSAVCVAARLFGGWLADHRAGGHVPFIAGLLAAGSVGLGLLALDGSVPLVLGVALGFGLGWAWPGLMNFAVVQLNPQAPAAATSITQTGVYAGGCVGPLALGAVAAGAGYPAMWLVAGVAMLLAAAGMLLGNRLVHSRSR